MRKRTKWLAFALSVLFLLQSGIGSIFAVSPEAAEDTSAPVSAPCACGNDAESLVDHDDACEAKFFAMTEAVDKSAEELFAAWNSYDVKVQNYILTYLGEHDPNRLEALEELFAGTSSESENTQVVVNELGATIAGNLPTDLSISSSNLSEEEYPEALKSTLASDSDMTFYGAIDITLYDGEGAEWQPADGNPVLVTIDASQFGLQDGDEIVVMHYHEDGTSEAMGPFTVENGTVIFQTTGFSSFAFVSGGADDVYWEMNPYNMYGAYRTIYLHNGHSITMKNTTGGTWTKLSDTTGTQNLGATGGTWAEYNISFDSNFPHGTKATYKVGSGNSFCYITIYFLGNPYYMQDGSYGNLRVFYVKPGMTITFPGSQTYTTLSGCSGTHNNLTFFGNDYTDGFLNAGSHAGAYYRISISGIEVRIITVSDTGSDVPYYSLAYNSEAGITMRCLMYPQNGIPSAGIAHPEEWSSFVTLSHSYTNAYISSSICSSLGRPVQNAHWSAILQAGSYQRCYDNYIYQNTSGNIANYTPSINYAGLLSQLANRGVYDWTGNALGSNTGDFTLVPYAIRFLMDGPTAGWVIDCYLAPKRTLSYSLNCPKTPSSISEPTGATNTVVYGATWTTTVATNLILNTQYSMTDGTAYIFLGWATSASGAVAYNPGASITISSNTTLYGVWEQVLLNFNLTFRVSGVNLTLDPDQSFVFRLQGSANDGTEIDVPFVVCGNNTVIFAELPVGNYAISVSDWAWRYGEWQWKDGAATEERSYTMGALNADTEFTFTAIRTDSLWLDDNAYVKAP